MKDRHSPGEQVLTETQRLYVERWLHAAGERLGLRGWDIRATSYIAKDGAEASSFIRDRSDFIEVAVSRDFAGLSPEERRATLVHELLHPHFHRITQLAEELIEHELGRRTEAVIDTAITFQEELAIERLANALAPLFSPVDLPTE